MNRKVSIDAALIRTLYYRYNQYIVPFIALVVCVFLVWFILVPEFQNWVTIRNQVAAERQKLEVLKQNFQVVAGLDETKLVSLAQTATAALPTEKDFVGILTAVSNAGSNASVPIGDYGFTIGNISQPGVKSQELTIPITLTITGGIEETKKFITQLKKQLPLSETQTVNTTSATSTQLTVVFFYSPYQKQPFNQDQPLELLTQSQESLLDSLNVQTVTPTSVATVTPTLAPTVTPTPTILPTPTHIASPSAKPTP